MSILNEQSALAEELTRYSRLCYERRLVGAAGGNLSVRVPDREVFIVTARGVSLRDVAPANLVVIDRSGGLLEGPAGFKPSKESAFHLTVYEARSDVGAIIHVHPPYATVFSLRRTTVPCVTISAQLKLKQGLVIAVAPSGSRELCDFVTQSIRTSPSDATIFLMEAHGLLAAHSSLGGAFDDAELAEDTAKIAFLAELAASRPFPFSGVGRLVDLSTPLHGRTPCYPTDPRFAKHWHLRYDENGVYVSKLEMGAHSGTHVDAPMHFLGDSVCDVAQMSPHLFLGAAVVLDRPKDSGQDLTVSDIAGADLRPGDIVLFRTGWDKHADSPAFFEGQWPSFQPLLVEELIARGVKAIGGDIPSADGPAALTAGAPAHKVAARAGMPVFEALVNLDKVAGQRFIFVGLPLKLAGAEASPIRAMAILQDS